MQKKLSQAEYDFNLREMRRQRAAEVETHREQRIRDLNQMLIYVRMIQTQDRWLMLLVSKLQGRLHRLVSFFLRLFKFEKDFRPNLAHIASEETNRDGLKGVERELLKMIRSMEVATATAEASQPHRSLSEASRTDRVSSQDSRQS